MIFEELNSVMCQKMETLFCYVFFCHKPLHKIFRPNYASCISSLNMSVHQAEKRPRISFLGNLHNFPNPSLPRFNILIGILLLNDHILLPRLCKGLSLTPTQKKKLTFISHNKYFIISFISVSRRTLEDSSS